MNWLRHELHTLCALRKLFVVPKSNLIEIIFARRKFTLMKAIGFQFMTACRQFMMRQRQFMCQRHNSFFQRKRNHYGNDNDSKNIGKARRS